MSLFGVALARLLSMRALERIGHGAGALVGVSSVVLGVAWVLTAAIVAGMVRRIFTKARRH